MNRWRHDRRGSGSHIVHRRYKRPVKGIGRPANETRPQANVERLQRLLGVLGKASRAKKGISTGYGKRIQTRRRRLTKPSYDGN